VVGVLAHALVSQVIEASAARTAQRGGAAGFSFVALVG
jgi:hypothetical protein